MASSGKSRRSQARHKARTSALLEHREIYYQKAVDIALETGDTSYMTERWKKLKAARTIKSNKGKRIGGRSF